MILGKDLIYKFGGKGQTLFCYVENTIKGLLIMELETLQSINQHNPMNFI